MPDADEAAAPAHRHVDPVALRRVRQRLAAARSDPWLHAEVARRMAGRLPIVKRTPAVVVDWCSGDAGNALRAACPRSELVRANFDEAPVRRRRWPVGPRRVAAAAVQSGRAGLLWSNMMLHWCPDPEAEMRRWHAALAVDGFLMFSTLGPGTLTRLRALYAQQGWASPHAAFVDMHDLGDMLVAVGFGDPVMDQEVLTLHWPDADALLAELRSLGGNIDPGRFAGLRTPRWRTRLAQAIAADDERPAMDFEVVYGHAFKPLPRVPVAAETRLGVQDLRSILGLRRQQG